jgi:hypothetical protein
LLPKLNSKTIRLVNNPRLVNQLAALERRTFAAVRIRSTIHPAAMTT